MSLFGSKVALMPMKEMQNTQRQTPVGRHERYITLHRTFSRHIENYCIRHSNSREEAEDLMQEVFIAVWENIDGLHPDSSPRQMNRWLQKVMRTVFVRHIRHQHIRADAPLAEAERLADTASGPPGDALLQELVEHLPPDDRQLLQERFDGYSNIEIAQHHGLKPNTLNKRMSRIVEKLKEIYTQLYEHEP